MGKELLNTLEIAWASPVLLIAGVDTGGDAAEVEAEVVHAGNHADMVTDVERFFLWGGGGKALLLLVMNTVIRQGTSHEDHKGLCSI